VHHIFFFDEELITHAPQFCFGGAKKKKDEIKKALSVHHVPFDEELITHAHRMPVALAKYAMKMVKCGCSIACV
jgi:hypothetical protein